MSDDVKLAMTVAFVVLVVTVALGVIGYLINRSAARRESAPR